MKKILVTVIVLIGIGYFINRKMDEANALKTLEFNIQKPILKNINTEMSVEAIIPIEISNESDIALEIENVIIDALYESIEIGTLNNEKLTVKPGVSIIEFPMSIKLNDVITNLPQLLLKEKIIINLKGNAVYKTETIKIPINVPIEVSYDLKEEIKDLMKLKFSF